LAGQSWDALRDLKQGDRLKVQDSAGQEVRGAFAAYSADAITVETSKGQVAIDRPKVRRVQVRSASHRARNAIIGAAIGVALAVTIDQTVGAYLRNETGDSGRAITYIAPIAGLGALGAAFPAYRTIYRVR
jgi:hypothetical protein